jgi:cytochrome b561
MQLGNSHNQWGAVTKSFHWVLAVLILSMIPVGWWMETLPLKERIEVTQLHKTLGFVVFLLVLGRLGWRVFQPVPPLPRGMPRYERLAAHGGHLALYVAILLQPIIGIVYVQSNALYENYPIKLGPLTIPDVVPNSDALNAFTSSAHSAVAWAILALVGIHVIAALKHHFLDRNTVLIRMLPGVRVTQEEDGKRAP